MAPHVEATCGALLFLGQPTDAAEAPTMKLFRPGQVADDTPNRKLQIIWTISALERSRPAADATREANGAVYGERLK